MRKAILAAATSALASYNKHIKPYVKTLEFARRFHVSSPPTDLLGAIYNKEFFGVDTYARFPAVGGFVYVRQLTVL